MGVLKTKSTTHLPVGSSKETLYRGPLRLLRPGPVMSLVRTPTVQLIMFILSRGCPYGVLDQMIYKLTSLVIVGPRMVVGRGEDL